ATMPTVIRILSRRHMFEPSPVHVQPQQLTVEEVEQIYYEVADRDKVAGLSSPIGLAPPERAMIFRQTKIGVDRLDSTLRRRGLPVFAQPRNITQPLARDGVV